MHRPSFSAYRHYRCRDAGRIRIPLNDWRLSNDQQTEVAATTNDSWETILGGDFDGSAVYRTELPEVDRNGTRVLLHFTAVATRAVVQNRWQRGWRTHRRLDPFRVDITDHYQPGQS